jgi:hexosaminidase
MKITPFGSQPPILLPYPQNLIQLGEPLQLLDNKIIALTNSSPHELFLSAQRAQQMLLKFAHLDWSIAAGSAIPEDRIGLLIATDHAFEKPQGYRMLVSNGQIRIHAHDKAGAFYGVQTLIQLLQQYASCLPTLEITDWPDLPNRGVLLDISRDKVPTMATLYHIVDLLAGWKINQFQLYTEHTFAYQNHPDVWTNASPITAEQVLALDAYCLERFIDLVPNQNCFGHMDRWLKHERYRPLSESPDGFTTYLKDPILEQSLEMTFEHPFSLNPINPDSITLIESLLAELLPNFRSTMVNVNCDETFDLGLDQSRQLCEEKGKGQVYLDFLLEIYQQVKLHGRTMQFWADILENHPEIIPQVPSDVIALEWGYEQFHPFAKKSKVLAEADIPFYVCPGTSSWRTISGRTDNAIGNIRNAVENGVRNGALGMLNTDWGDCGHWQQLPISYLGWAYGAGTSWAFDQNVNMNVPVVLDRFAFQDKAGIMGKLVFDLGNVYRQTGLSLMNSSILFWAYLIPLDLMTRSDVPDCVKTWFSKIKNFPAKLHETIRHIDEVISSLDQTQMMRSDADLIVEELRFTSDMLKHGAHRLLVTFDKQAINRADMAAEFTSLIKRYRKLWLARNREGGLDDSVNRLTGRLSAMDGVSWVQIPSLVIQSP